MNEQSDDGRYFVARFHPRDQQPTLGMAPGSEEYVLRRDYSRLYVALQRIKSADPEVEPGAFYIFAKETAREALKHWTE
jgi:hypothetical protein